MRSKIPHVRLIKQPLESVLNEVDYIEVAADLLQQMFSKLQSLALRHAEFAGVMSIRGPHAHARLLALQETIDVLARADSPEAADQLKRRAGALIVRLADEFDALVLYA
jgi:hypothetical protein